MGMYGVDKATAPQLMAEIGNVRRFVHRGSLVAYAGAILGDEYRRPCFLSQLRNATVVLADFSRWFDNRLRVQTKPSLCILFLHYFIMILSNRQLCKYVQSGWTAALHRCNKLFVAICICHVFLDDILAHLEHLGYIGYTASLAAVIQEGDSFYKLAGQLAPGYEDPAHTFL